MEIAENVSELWNDGDFDEKTRLQKLVFPNGIVYNKENDSVRTIYTNALFASIPLLMKFFDKNENARLNENGHLSNQVGMSGFEPIFRFSNYVSYTFLKFFSRIRITESFLINFLIPISETISSPFFKRAAI